MGTTAERASKRTQLRFGLASAPVALFKTTTDRDLPEFEKAGPNGGKLVTENRPDPAATVMPEKDTPVPPSEEELDAARRALESVTAKAAAAAAATAAASATVPVTLEEGTGVEVTEPRRGIRLEDETFVDLTDHLKDVDERTNLEAMDVVAFIRREQVPRGRIQGSYFLGTDGPGAWDLLAHLYLGISDTGRVPVVRWTKNKNQAVGVIIPNRYGRGAEHLVVLELAFVDQLRMVPERADLMGAVAVAKGETVKRAAARELINAMADSSAALDEVRDERAALLRELVERAQAGEFEGFSVPERPEVPDNVVDLTALLRASIERAREFTAVA